MSQPTVKLCKDCRHCQPAQSGDWCMAQCTRQFRESPVSGETSYGFCDIERAGLFTCGADAKFFEPKPPTTNPA